MTTSQEFVGMERGGSVIEFNANSFVWLKLTDKGRRIHRESLADYPVLLNYIETDADGYTKFQLWEAMQLFGKHIGLGFDLVFETTIRLEDSK